MHSLYVSGITSDRFRMEEALRASEERYILATSAAGIGTWELVAQNGHLEASSITWRLMGFRTLPVQQTLESSLTRVHPDDIDRVRKKIKLAVQMAVDYQSEFRVLSPSGEIRWVKSYGRMFYSAEGGVTKVFGVTYDVTEQKNMMAELKKAKEEAEAAAIAKAQFLANMSHEIRTPMNSILGFASLLNDSALSAKERRAYQDRILQSGQHLLRIIDDILDLSKFESGHFLLERLVFSPVSVINEIVQSLANQANAKGLTVSVQLRGPVPEVIESDPVRFRQILVNLLGNAIKFTEKGKVEILIKHKTSSKGTRFLEIEIHDTGIGIDASSKRNLFKPFGQADPSITRKFGGTGLGLVLSRKLAKALGGNLTLRSSEPNKGSCFRLDVPVGTPVNHRMTSSIEQIEMAIEPQPASGGKKRLSEVKVLLAEDSPDNEILMRIFLEKEGALIQVAHDGIEAFDMAQKGSFDIVLMDVQMPRMDGLESTRKLRAQGYTGPILALTAHALREEVERSLKAGCDEHITKPVNRHNLVDTICRHLHNKAPRQ